MRDGSECQILIGASGALLAILLLIAVLTTPSLQVALGLSLVDPPAQPQNSIFGFAEFITALALLAVIYTVSDVRYHFRIAVAPIPLFAATFSLAAVAGFGTLFIDLWFAERWPIPRLLADRTLDEALLAALVLLMVFAWMYYSFIRPPVFGRGNCKKFAQELFRIILRGSDSELPVIAAELGRSAEALVRLTTEFPVADNKASSETWRKIRAPDYAFDILRMIGNRKFCRHLVASAPGTVIGLFRSATDLEKHRIPLGEFGRNISHEALINKDSILYHEDVVFSGDLIGRLRPFSGTVYGNFPLVESLAENSWSPLDLDYRLTFSWDAVQVEAYSQLVLLTLESYLATGSWPKHSYALYRAIDNIRAACRDAHKLNKNPQIYNSDAFDRLQAAVKFAIEAVKLIDKQENPPKPKYRHNRNVRPLNTDFYDHLAQLMFDIAFAASEVREPADECWMVQYSSVWGEFFGLQDGPAWGAVRFKLRRLLYDEVRRLEKFPNYKSARVLGFCLNVMGLTIATKQSEREEYPLRRAILNWTSANYLRLKDANPDVASVCLMGSIAFDSSLNHLVKTYAKGLRREAPKAYLELRDP
jgi:hypothetical protein